MVRFRESQSLASNLGTGGTWGILPSMPSLCSYLGEARV